MQPTSRSPIPPKETVPPIDEIPKKKGNKTPSIPAELPKTSSSATLETKKVEAKEKKGLDKTTTAAEKVVKAPVPPPPLSVGQRVIHFVSKKVVEVAKGKYNFEEINEDSKRKLVELTGNQKLALAFIAVTPKLTQVILKAISEKLDGSKKFYKEGLKKTLQEQHQLINDSLQATLLKMMAKVALDTKIQQRTNKVSFPDIISHLLGITENYLIDIHSKIAKIEKIPDEKARKKALKELLKPFSDEILKKLLPAGEKDIVLPDGLIMGEVKEQIYKSLKDALPDLIVKYYHAVMDPTMEKREADEAALKEFPGGDVLNALADFAAKKIPQKVPDLVADHSWTISKELAPEIFQVEDKSREAELKLWLGNGIYKIVTSQDPQIQGLWGFSQYYLSPIIKHAFLKMAETSKAEDPTNILKAISKRFLSVTTHFFEKNHEKIDELLDEMKKPSTEDVRADQEAALIKLFEPLSKELIEFIGLDRPDELPVPTFLREVIVKIASEQVPKRLVKLYKDMNPVRIDDPNRQKFARIAEVLIDNFVPALAVNAQINAPETIAKMLNTEVGIDQNNTQLSFINFAFGLFTDPNAVKTGEYLKAQATEIFTDVLLKIASTNLPTDIRIKDKQPVDLLPNLLGQMINLSKTHVTNEILLKIKELKTASPEEQITKKKELLVRLRLLSQNLLDLAGYSTSLTLPGPGELKSPLYDFLVETALPQLLLDTLQGLTQTAVDRKEIDQAFKAEDLKPLEKASQAIAQNASSQIQKALGGKSNELLTWVNTNLPIAQLPEEEQKWLSQELKKIGLSQSPSIKEGWGFLQNYIESLTFNVLGSLALQYNRDHAAEERLQGNKDVFKQATLQLITLAAEEIQDFNKDLLKRIKNLEQLPPKNRASELKKLAPKLTPMILKIFNQIGIKNAQSLPVPSFVKEILWKNLTETALPEMLVGYLSDALVLTPQIPTKEDTEGLENLEQLDETTNTLVSNLVPMAQSFIEKNKEEYATKVHETINKVLPGIFNEETIKSLINEVIDPRDVGVQKLMTALSEAVKDFITPILVNIASSSAEGDVLEEFISNVSDLIARHFKNKIEDYDSQLTDYETLTEAGKTNLLEEVFGAFLDEVFEQAQINVKHLPQGARALLLTQTYNLYRLFKSPIDTQQKSRLNMYQLVGVDINELKDDFDEYAEEQIQPIQNALSFLADKIQTQIKSYMAEEGPNLVNQLNDVLPKKKLSDKEKEWLSQAFANIANSQDEGVSDFWNYTSEVLNAALLKLFGDLASQIPDASKAKNALIPEILKKVAGVLGANLAGLQQKIKEINKTAKNEEERKLELRKLFIPLAKGFFSLAGSDPLGALPIPNAFKEGLMKALEEKILPDLLGSVYVDIAKWELNSEEDRVKLMDLFLSKNPATAAKILGRFTTDILPSAIKDPENRVSEKLFKAFAKFILQQPEERANAIYKYMQEHPQEMQNLIKENFAQLLDPHLGVTGIVFPELEKLIETGLLKCMANVFSKIQERQNQDKNLLVNVGLKMIKTAIEHFSEINRIMEKEHKSLPYEIDPETFRREFKGLHEAIPKDPHLSAEENQRILYQNFLIPITEEALKLAGINSADDLPLPAASPELREKLFDSLKKDLGPLIIETMMSSLNVDKMLLSVLEAVNKEMEHPSDLSLGTEIENDDTQKELNSACGDLFLSMIKLIPHTAVRTFFMSEKMRNIPATSIGKIVRNQLLKTNILDAVNKAMVSGLPALSSKITVNEKGELQMPEDFHFKFPETDRARFAQKIVKGTEEIVFKKIFVLELTKTLRNIIIFRIKDFFNAHWKTFQALIDNWIKTKFGKKGLAFKKDLDRICRMIFINFLGTALQIIAYPFIRLLGFIINIHLKRKSEQISKTMHMDIHKNLIFKLAEMTFETFNTETKGTKETEGTIAT